MLYPQNGDRIVATDFVTSLHPMYKLSKTGVSNILPAARTRNLYPAREALLILLKI